MSKQQLKIVEQKIEELSAKLAESKQREKVACIEKVVIEAGIKEHLKNIVVDHSLRVTEQSPFEDGGLVYKKSGLDFSKDTLKNDFDSEFFGVSNPTKRSKLDVIKGNQKPSKKMKDLMDKCTADPSPINMRELAGFKAKNKKK
jgi:hypothetical protein